MGTREHRFVGPVDLRRHLLRSDAMSNDPTEDPPLNPGQPKEPPSESPPGNPRPEVPPPVREPGEPARPDELPGDTPDELPVVPPNPPTPPAPIDIQGFPSSLALPLNDPDGGISGRPITG